MGYGKEATKINETKVIHESCQWTWSRAWESPNDSIEAVYHTGPLIEKSRYCDSCWLMIAKYKCIFDEVITLPSLSNLHLTEVPCFWIDVMLLMDLLRDLSSTFFTGRIFVIYKLKDRICSRKAILASCYRLDKNMISHKLEYG